MSLTLKNFTNNPEDKSGPKPTGPDKKVNPGDKLRERERERLQKQQQTIQKRLDTMKASIAGPIRELARVVAQGNPNEDPQELFRQIRPLLSKMGLAVIADASRTEIVVGKQRKNDSLYKVTLRRIAQISGDNIERMKRYVDNFESMQWSAKALELYLWYPYKSAEEDSSKTPSAPVVPKCSNLQSESSGGGWTGDIEQDSTPENLREVEKLKPKIINILKKHSKWAISNGSEMPKIKLRLIDDDLKYANSSFITLSIAIHHLLKENKILGISPYKSGGIQQGAERSELRYSLPE